VMTVHITVISYTVITVSIIVHITIIRLYSENSACSTVITVLNVTVSAVIQ